MTRMSSRYSAKVATKIMEYLQLFQRTEMGFLYTERSNTLFVGYGCLYVPLVRQDFSPHIVCLTLFVCASLIGAGIFLPLLALYRRRAK
jgi:hypothetical protein